MALTDSEIESLRHHLGYGNIDTGAYPYTPDGFKELFDDVIAPNLTGDTVTSSSTSITADASVTVTPAAMTGIAVYARLVVDVGEAQEVVDVKAAGVSTFTAVFANAHSGTYPVALMGGHARLRMLLAQADKAWSSLQSQEIGLTAGLQSVEKGDVVWFPGFQVLKNRWDHFMAIVGQISQLVRVESAWPTRSGTAQLEAY